MDRDGEACLTDSRARVAEKWKDFREGSAKRRKRMLGHTFAFCIDDIGSGWEYVHFEVDGKNVCSCRVSYIGPDVHAFVRTVTSLKDRDLVEFTFLNEPGGYDFLFSRRDGNIYVELPNRESGLFLRYDYFVEQIMDGFHRAYRN